MFIYTFLWIIYANAFAYERHKNYNSDNDFLNKCGIVATIPLIFWESITKGIQPSAMVCEDQTRRVVPWSETLYESKSYAYI